MINTKTIMIAARTAARPTCRYPELQNAPALTVQQAIRLVDLAIVVEDFFKDPVDIEWCRRGDQLFMLQARPITTRSPP